MGFLFHNHLVEWSSIEVVSILGNVMIIREKRR